MCSTGFHGNKTSHLSFTLVSGFHQIVVEYVNVASSQATVSLVITDPAMTDVSSNYVHDPAGPCNADCASCNADQQYCEGCAVPGAVPSGGVCPSPLSAG